jgi:hypothetical protein
VKTYTEESARALVATLDPEQQVRRWGWEIESPQVGEAKGGSTWAEIEGLEFCSDGSLSGSDCDCDCSDCTYHECNCDNCENYNSDPDHCGSCGTNEVSSREPMLTPRLDRWADFLARLKRYWEPMENYDENWGGHIHVEARDLDKRQAVAVVAIGERLFDLAPDWFSGGADGYNERQDRERLRRVAQDPESSFYSTNRASWVSVYNLRQLAPESYQVGELPDGRKSTIEFRAFRSTPDRELIEFRALVCRKVVEFAKANSSIYWATSAKTFDQLLGVLGV